MGWSEGEAIQGRAMAILTATTAFVDDDCLLMIDGVAYRA